MTVEGNGKEIKQSWQLSFEYIRATYSTFKHLGAKDAD